MRNLISLFFAFILTLVLVPAGIVYHLIASVLSVLSLKFWQGVYKFFTYWFIFLAQLYNAVSYIAYHCTNALDLIWNSVAGDLIERIGVEKKNRGLSSFGRGNFRLTETLGSSSNNQQLNNRGKVIMKFFDIIYLSINYCHTAISKIYYRKSR